MEISLGFQIFAGLLMGVGFAYFPWVGWIGLAMFAYKALQFAIYEAVKAAILDAKDAAERIAERRAEVRRDFGT